MFTRVIPAVAAATGLFFGATSMALAGDAATLNILGFSADGGIFAFEEYGIQDGSGFPYANRYYIDTATDSFTGGSPFRVRIDDETADITDARNAAKAQGEAVIGDAILSANPGFTAAANAITETSADPFRLAANPRPVVPPIDAPVEVRLAEIPFLASGTCAGIQEETTGFRLTQIATQVGQSVSVLHEDTAVPASRGCPNGYRLGAIQTFFPDGGSPVMAVMIAVISFGFEGPDHRWMAVTAPLSGSE